MSQDCTKRLFIAYQSLYIQYKERADAYRRQVGREVQVYSDCVARLALSKADYYERRLNTGYQRRKHENQRSSKG